MSTKLADLPEGVSVERGRPSGAHRRAGRQVESPADVARRRPLAIPDAISQLEQLDQQLLTRFAVPDGRYRASGIPRSG